MSWIAELLPQKYPIILNLWMKNLQQADVLTHLNQIYSLKFFRKRWLRLSGHSASIIYLKHYGSGNLFPLILRLVVDQSRSFKILFRRKSVYTYIFFIQIKVNSVLVSCHLQKQTWERWPIRSAHVSIFTVIMSSH